MKNSKGFYIRSAACRAAEEDGKMCINFKCPEQEARYLFPAVEWHHGGAGVIAFFPANEKEIEAVQNLRERLRNRTIKSKKAAIEYLRQSSGDFEIPYKIGKYGEFFNFWGEPDGTFSISTDDPNFEAIRSLLNI